MAYDFDTIARDYDRMNRLMTFGLDRCWRKRAVKEFSILNSQFSILDVACGTGDMCLLLARQGCTVTGVDLSEEMLAVARHKLAHASVSYSLQLTPSPTVLVGTPPNLGGEPECCASSTSLHTQQVHSSSSPKLGEVDARRADGGVCQGGVCLRLADAEHLPFEDEAFDAVTCAFGIRNFVHLEQGLKEMVRVLKPGGRMVILELSTPDSPLVRPFYNLYTRHIIPWLGSRIAGNREAYTYLPSSIERFPKGAAMMDRLKAAGGREVKQRKLTFGVCRCYILVK
ncbi:MAG: class I SAM-dependent methyltransferase [Bacteroidales bacterium]|nr:class I SAM-dependent methyltransferase [Bacteroidales bacterium]